MHYSLDYHVNYAWEAYLTTRTKKKERRRRRERRGGRPISTHVRAVKAVNLLRFSKAMSY
jgi:hypothetical protein